MSGPVEWNVEPIGIAVHFRHLSMLERAAAAGRSWAHAARAPDAPLLYVAAGGFEPGFSEIADRDGRTVVILTLDDLFEA